MYRYPSDIVHGCRPRHITPDRTGIVGKEQCCCFSGEEYDQLVSELSQLKKTLSSTTAKTEHDASMEARCSQLNDNVKKLQVRG